MTVVKSDIGGNISVRYFYFHRINICPLELSRFLFAKFCNLASVDTMNIAQMGSFLCALLMHPCLACGIRQARKVVDFYQRQNF